MISTRTLPATPLLSLDDLRRLVDSFQLAGHVARPPRFVPEIVVDGAAHRPSQAMLQEAHRRNAAPRSLTAWLMGDPAPGQSALDKRTCAA
jgi:hypothetical protein